jgi:large subunit ribosomal protein L6
MSRIGKKPIDIPQGVKVELKDSSVTVSGPLGSLQIGCLPQISVTVDQAQQKILVENKQPEDRRSKQLHGTIRALIANMVTGVTKGYEKTIEIYGTGYSVKEQGGKLLIQVGFAHPVELTIPKGIKLKIEVAATRGDDVPARFTLSSIDKHLLGQFASDVRRVRPPEPYKGKGIRYAGEHIKRKAGKAFTTGAA